MVKINLRKIKRISAGIIGGLELLALVGCNSSIRTSSEISPPGIYECAPKKGNGETYTFDSSNKESLRLELFSSQPGWQFKDTETGKVVRVYDDNYDCRYAGPIKTEST